ncbi:Hsp33 family molecular chaperone HslO [Desulfobacterales bacterium HSG16]|nr:Hsp33 family molecular chaperone HslO [Desulfobacterales bacterium HSG16]
MKAGLKAGAKDRLQRFLIADGTVRGAVLYSTKMVREMRANHSLGILETLVLGHAYMAAALMTASLKGNDRISLQIDCSGTVKGLVVESNAFGEVRGYLKNTMIPIDKPLENFNLSPFFGAGFLSVTKYLEDAKQPFTGKIPLYHGSIARDLTRYFLDSEQLPTAFHLSIKFDTDGHVIGAGALFLQAMPDADETLAADLENIVGKMPSLGTVFSDETKDAKQVVSENFSRFQFKWVGDYRVEFMCHCNEEKIKAMLMMLPVEDLKDLSENGPFPVKILCHHCNTSYQFDEASVKKIFGIRYPDN